MSSHSIVDGLKGIIPDTTFVSRFDPMERYDVVIQFFAGEGLPKTDLIGHSDPYIIATIDKKMSFTSSIQSNTGSPRWENEKWLVRNIPFDATLFVALFDKDDEKPHDDHIGQFEILTLTNYHPPPGGHTIRDIFGKSRGRFHLCIQARVASDESKQLPEYTFDGPCRYFCHTSVGVGRLTMLNADCVYFTWKIELKRISTFFPPYQRQHWNKKYAKAQLIFGETPVAFATKAALKIGHKALYKRTLRRNEHGGIESAADLWKCVFTDKLTKKIRPCIYTYVLDDHTWRFSETGHQFFLDLASKHALLANGLEYVLYAGEFHVRPKYGWERDDEEWELVIDNGSGTYAPSVDLLGKLKELLEFNFPGLHVVTFDFNDPQLKESEAQLKEAMKRYKGTTPAIGHMVVNHPMQLE